MTALEIQIKRIIENLQPDEAAKEILRLFSAVGRSEQLTAFTTWLSENHSIELHDMILQDYIRYGG
jgi:hypothetical protein